MIKGKKMKTIFTILVANLLLTGTVLAQGQFSANLSNAGNVITFKLKPNSTTTTGFSVIEFFIRYTTTSPSFTYGTVTVNTTDFPGMSGNGNVGGGSLGSGAWEIERDNPAYMVAGYHVDHFIYTAPALATTPNTYTGGTEYTVLSVPLIGTASTVDFEFVSDDQEAIYYLAITDQNGGELRPASPTNYFFPATLSKAGTSGTTIYYQALTNVTLPVKFLDFSVAKKDKDAVISWAVENEDENADKYIVERSVNGNDFKAVETVPALNNGSSNNTYTVTQRDINAIANSGLIYYRVKQVDKGGKSVYTATKNIKLDSKAFAVKASPNLVRTTTTLTIDLAKDSKLLVSVTDANGKQIKNIQLQGFKGTNIKELNLDGLAAGNYMLKVNTGEEVKTLPIVKAN